MRSYLTAALEVSFYLTHLRVKVDNVLYEGEETSHHLLVGCDPGKRDIIIVSVTYIKVEELTEFDHLLMHQFIAQLDLGGLQQD